MSSPNWENTRKHARLLESRLDSKLSSYSRLATQISGGGVGGGNSGKGRDEFGLAEEGVGGYKLMEEEIEELLEKVRKNEHISKRGCDLFADWVTYAYFPCFFLPAS